MTTTTTTTTTRNNAVSMPKHTSSYSNTKPTTTTTTTTTRAFAKQSNVKRMSHIKITPSFCNNHHHNNSFLLLFWMILLVAAATRITTTNAFSIIPTPYNSLFSSIPFVFQKGGGRAPDNTSNQIDDDDDDDSNNHMNHKKSPRHMEEVKEQEKQQRWQVTLPGEEEEEEEESKLIIFQITDVYSLEHLASFKTLVQETKQRCSCHNNNNIKVVSVLTGDFLSPYLLSSVDRGAGMMKALSDIPLDYIMWGNHEADIDHNTVCRYVKQFPGIWLNSNMLDHDAMEYQQEYDVIEIPYDNDNDDNDDDNTAGSSTIKVGLCAVLDNDPALYSHFEHPGAFGGATISDPWEALTKYQTILEQEENCDLVLPLQHLYVPDDHKTCRQFDFPVILSGHDHHRVDETVCGTRLLKPGMNAEYATVLELTWKKKKKKKNSSKGIDDDDNDKTTTTARRLPDNITAQFVKCSDWEPCPKLQAQNQRAYDCLEPLRRTELARVPPHMEPLTSATCKENVCTMGQFICSLLKSSLNSSRTRRKYQIDAVMFMAYNLKGKQDYELGSYFSLESLETEIKSDETIGVVPMPGWLLAAAIEETHTTKWYGYMQYDDGIQQQQQNDANDGTRKVTHVAGEPIDPHRVYRVACKIPELTYGDVKSWGEYYTEHRELLPPQGSYVNIHAELMEYFARNLWRRLWDAISREVNDNCAIVDDNNNDDDDGSSSSNSSSGCNPEERLAVLDRDGSGVVTVEEIQMALSEKLGYSIDQREKSLAEFVHSFADQTGDGRVTKHDFEMLCDEMARLREDQSDYSSTNHPSQRQHHHHHQQQQHHLRRNYGNNENKVVIVDENKFVLDADDGEVDEKELLAGTI